MKLSDITSRGYDLQAVVPWSEVEPGCLLMADNGFDCIDEGQVLQVLQARNSELYVCCKDGKHHLDGQINEGRDGIVGFYLVRKKGE